MYSYSKIISNTFLKENNFQRIFIMKLFAVYFYNKIILNVFL